MYTFYQIGCGCRSFCAVIFLFALALPFWCELEKRLDGSFSYYTWEYLDANLVPIRITRQREKRSSHKQNGETPNNSAAFYPNERVVGESGSSHRRGGSPVKGAVEAHRHFQQTMGDKQAHHFLWDSGQVSACHPERSEGSGSPDTEMLRCAQQDSQDTAPVRSRGTSYLQLSLLAH